jgi:hypothetical protein
MPDRFHHPKDTFFRIVEILFEPLLHLPFTKPILKLQRDGYVKINCLLLEKFPKEVGNAKNFPV